MQHALANVARYRAVGERNRLSVGQFQGTNVKCVGAAMFGKVSAGNAIAAAAFKRVEVVQIGDDAAQALGQRHHVGADPVREGGSHGAAENGRGLYRYQPLVRQHHRLQPDEVLAPATAGAVNIWNTGGDGDLFG